MPLSLNADAASAVVEVSGVLFEYPGVRALDDVSISIARGSVTALVGPNGAGKTTLLRCIAGLERPMLGSITVAGIDVLEAPRESHRKMGYLSDFYGLYETLSVRQNLQHAAAGQGIEDSATDALVARTAERLGLADRLDVKTVALSRGQRQRVAIGQALVHQPEVLILDEPASGLDPEARQNLAQLFRALQSEGMTLIVSSHILAELDEYCSHMLVMQQGRIIENKTLSAIAADSTQIRIALDQPLAALAARLAGIGGINVLECSDSDALVTIDDGAASAVLRKLIEAGVPVASFAPERHNLAESYLRTVQAAKAEKP